MSDLLPDWLLLTALAMLGAVLGSYVNVVVWRLPQGMSTATPASACPACGHRIRPWDDVPVLSWLILRGRCRDCSARISVRYPLVEAGVALLFVALGAALGDRVGLLALAAVLALATGGTAMTLIDLEHHRLPNKVTASTAAFVVPLLAAQSVLDGQQGRLLLAAGGGIAFFVLYLTMALVYPAGMGGGDVKLAPLLGFALGWFGVAHLVVGFIAPFALGAVAVAALATRGKVRRGTGIPFGPSMVVGTLASIVAAEPVASWYLQVSGLA